MTVRFLDTGVANRASLRAAFARLGVDTRPIADPDELAGPDPVVLPGVGSFGAAMEALGAQGLVDAVRQRVQRGDPLLAVCVGLQVFAAGSDESPGVEGLGVVPATVRQLPAAPRRPQLGWNGVGGRAVYFANGYALPEAPGFETASFVYGDQAFVGAAWRGRVWGLQFHPELSGDAGAAWLRAWLAGDPPPIAEGSVGSTRRIVPCLDIDGGRVVKGVRFQGLTDQGDPVALAAAYAAQGADELVLLDVSATPEGRGHAVGTVARVRRVLDVPLTVGGGVRTVADARALLEAGADKVAVNTAAVARPALLTELAARFGRQCVVLSVDAARDPDGTPRLKVRSGTERVGREVVGWCVEGVQRGAGEILLTSWDRDGTGEGYDLPLLRAVCEAVEVPVVASGGARDASCFAAGLEAGADAVLAASMFHEARTTVASVKQAVSERKGFALRMGSVRGSAAAAPSALTPGDSELGGDSELTPGDSELTPGDGVACRSCAAAPSALTPQGVNRCAAAPSAQGVNRCAAAPSALTPQGVNLRRGPFRSDTPGGEPTPQGVNR